MKKTTLFGLTAGLFMAMSATAANPAYTFDPASGSVVTDLQTITVDFTEVPVYFYENNRVAAAVLENKSTGDTYVCEEPTRDTRATTNGIAYTLTFIHENATEAEPVTVAGDYELTLRAMYIVEGEENVDLEPITATYTINYPVDYTLNPAAGTVADLQGIKLTFPEVKVGFYENSRMPAAVLENLTSGSVYQCAAPDLNTTATVAGSEYTLMFNDLEDMAPAAIAEPGEYLLTIRAMYQGEGDDAADLPVITAKYTVNYPAAFTIDPAFGTSVEDLTTINIDFTEDVVAFYENSRMPVAVLENITTGNTYVCSEPMLDSRAMTNGKAYSLTFVSDENDEASAITEPGYYKFTLRGMYKTVEGENVDLPVIYGDYFISYPVAYDLNPVADATVESISTVTIQFPETKNVKFYENNRMPVAVITNLATDAVYVCQEADQNTNTTLENGVEYSFTFVDEAGDAVVLTEPGKYQLAIRAMYQEAGEDNIDLPAIIANYTIAYPVAYTLYPDNGAKAADLMQIALEFPDNTVSFYENNRVPVAVLENTTTGTVYNCQEATRDTFAQTEGSAYLLTFIGENEDEAMPVTEPGQYKLTIRAMYQTVDDENVDLPVIYADYEVPFPVNYYLYPDNGATVENLQGVTIQFPDNVVSFYENNQMPVAVLENTTTGAVYNCQEADRNTFSTEGTEYSFTFIGEDDDEAMPITEPGQYKLTIRAMYQTVDDENVDLPVITANYTIAYPVEYELNPDNGASVENLKTVSLIFPVNKNVSFDENNRMPVAVLVNNTTGAEYVCRDADTNTNSMFDEGVEYTLTFIAEGEDEAADITELGNYTLTIRALEIEDADGEKTPLPVITANYTINYPVTYFLTPMDGDNVEEIAQIELEFPYNTNVGFYENNQMPVAVITELGEGTEYICETADRNTTAETEGVAYTLRFMNFETSSYEPITAEGTYKLVIRALAVLDEDDAPVSELPVIEATYYIVTDGIGAVSAIEAADAYNVFDINGIRIVLNGSANDVKALPAGLYIINGQKVLIRK